MSSIATPYVKCVGGSVVSLAPKFDFIERGRGQWIDAHPNNVNSAYLSNAQMAVNGVETVAYISDADYALWALNLGSGVYTPLVSRAAKQWAWATALLVSPDGQVLWVCDPYSFGMFKVVLKPIFSVTQQTVPAIGGNFRPRAQRLVWDTTGTLMSARTAHSTHSRERRELAHWFSTRMCALSFPSLCTGMAPKVPRTAC